MHVGSALTAVLLYNQHKTVQTTCMVHCIVVNCHRNMRLWRVKGPKYEATLVAIHFLLPSSRTSHVHFLPCSSVVAQEEIELRRSLRTDYRTSWVRGCRHLRPSLGRRWPVGWVALLYWCHHCCVWGPVALYTTGDVSSYHALIVLQEGTYSCFVRKHFLVWHVHIQDISFTCL